MLTRRAIWVLLALLATGCLCDPDQNDQCQTQTGPGPNSGVLRIQVDNGDGQLGPVGQILKDELSIRISDAQSGALRDGVQLRFSVEAGGGALLVGTVGTGASFSGGALTVSTKDGFASVRLQLGSSPGENRVRAELVGTQNFERFTAMAHGPAARVVIEGGDGQTADAGADLPVRPAVKITDAQGIQVPGLRVWFRPQGGEPAQGDVVQSGNNGVARMSVAWQLGLQPGPQTLVAEVLVGSQGNQLMSLAGNPVTFQATARPFAPSSVGRHPTGFPNPQQGVAGQAVAVRPTVRVTGPSGQPAAGVTVRFEVTAGWGGLGGATGTHDAVTGADGVAAVPMWILGAPGPNQVTATVQAPNVSGNPVTFDAVAALPAGARVSAVTSLVVAVQPGAAVVPRPTVKVVDQQNNPIRGLEVTFAAGATGGTVAGGTQTTDADGLASVGEWRAGGNFGTDYALVATVTGSGIANNPVTFVARTPVAGQVLYMAITAGNNQSAVVGTQVPVAPQVRVINQAGNGVVGVVINWSVTQGAGTFVPNTVTTNGQGYATLDYFAPSAVGQIVLLASTTDSRVQPSALGFNLQGLAP